MEPENHNNSEENPIAYDSLNAGEQVMEMRKKMNEQKRTLEQAGRRINDLGIEKKGMII